MAKKRQSHGHSGQGHYHPSEGTPSEVHSNPGAPNTEPDPHLQDEHYAPSVTMPQGTQAEGVEHGHEERDIQAPMLVRWFGLMMVALVAQIALLWGLYSYMGATSARVDMLPSELFGQRTVPPPPRLLPNPVDSAQEPLEPLEDEFEYHQEQKILEDEELVKQRLLDPKTGLGAMPDDAVGRVLSSRGAAGAPGGAAGAQPPPNAEDGKAPEYALPSEQSGGQSTEDYLR